MQKRPKKLIFIFSFFQPVKAQIRQNLLQTHPPFSWRPSTITRNWPYASSLCIILFWEQYEKTTLIFFFFDWKNKKIWEGIRQSHVVWKVWRSPPILRHLRGCHSSYMYNEVIHYICLPTWFLYQISYLFKKFFLNLIFIFYMLKSIGSCFLDQSKMSDWREEHGSKTGHKIYHQTIFWQGKIVIQYERNYEWEQFIIFLLELGCYKHLKKDCFIYMFKEKGKQSPNFYW